MARILFQTQSEFFEWQGYLEERWIDDIEASFEDDGTVVVTYPDAAQGAVDLAYNVATGQVEEPSVDGDQDAAIAALRAEFDDAKWKLDYIVNNAAIAGFVAGDMDEISQRISSLEAYTQSVSSGSSAEIADIQSSISALQATLDLVQDEATDTQAIASDAFAQATTNNQAITALHGDLAAIDTRVTDSEVNIATLSSVVAAIDTRVADVESDIVSLEMDTATLDARVTSSESSIAVIDARVTAAEGDITTLQADVAALQQTGGVDLTPLQNDVSALQGGVAQLDTRVTQNESDIDALQVEVARIVANEQLIQIPFNTGNIPRRTWTVPAGVPQLTVTAAQEGVWTFSVVMTHPTSGAAIGARVMKNGSPVVYQTVEGSSRLGDGALSMSGVVVVAENDVLELEVAHDEGWSAISGTLTAVKSF